MLTWRAPHPNHTPLTHTQIFDKALTETHFAELYADLVAALNPALPSLKDEEGNDVQFRRTLLNKCQARGRAAGGGAGGERWWECWGQARSASWGRPQPAPSCTEPATTITINQPHPTRPAPALAPRRRSLRRA